MFIVLFGAFLLASPFDNHIDQIEKCLRGNKSRILQNFSGETCSRYLNEKDLASIQRMTRQKVKFSADDISDNVSMNQIISRMRLMQKELQINSVNDLRTNDYAMKAYLINRNQHEACLKTWCSLFHEHIGGIPLFRSLNASVLLRQTEMNLSTSGKSCKATACLPGESLGDIPSCESANPLERFPLPLYEQQSVCRNLEDSVNKAEYYKLLVDYNHPNSRETSTYTPAGRGNR